MPDACLRQPWPAPPAARMPPGGRAGIADRNVVARLKTLSAPFIFRSSSSVDAVIAAIGGLEGTPARVVAFYRKVFAIAHHLHDIQGRRGGHGLGRRAGANGVQAPDRNNSSSHGASCDRRNLAHRTLRAESATP